MSLEPGKALAALLWAPPPSSAHPGSPWQCQQQSCLAMVICCVPSWALPPSSSTLLLHNSMYRYSYVGNESSGWSDRQGGCVCVCVCTQYFVVQSLSCVSLFATPKTAACQASLSFTISWSLLRLMSLESLMPSNHLVLCCPLLLLPFPESGSFLMSQLLASGGQSIGVSASASVLPTNIQD